MIARNCLEVKLDKMLSLKPEDEKRLVTTGLTWSYTDSPSSEPGYPVPELPTIILFGLGLAGLGIYYWLRKRPRTLATKS